MSLGQNVVAQDMGPDDTAAQGPAPTVGVPFSWGDASSVYLWMQNSTIFSGVPNWVVYGVTGLALYSMLSNRSAGSSSRKRKRH